MAKHSAWRHKNWSSVVGKKHVQPHIENAYDDKSVKPKKKDLPRPKQTVTEYLDKMKKDQQKEKEKWKKMRKPRPFHPVIFDNPDKVYLREKKAEI